MYVHSDIHCKGGQYIMKICAKSLLSVGNDGTLPHAQQIELHDLFN